MRDEAFQTAQALLVERGLVIDESRHDDRSFGSWFIYVRTIPRLGLVWDGRDSWLSVRREVDGMWQDLWTGRAAREQEPSVAVDKLLELAR